MAKTTLYLDIFAFNLHKIKDSHSVTTPSGGTGTKYTSSKDNSSFEEFFNVLDGESYEDKFKSFINDFIGKFNLQYTVKRDKGISMNHTQRIDADDAQEQAALVQFLRKSI